MRTDAPTMRGATWGEDGNIIAALNSGAGLSRVSAAGGTPQPRHVEAALDQAQRAIQSVAREFVNRVARW